MKDKPDDLERLPRMSPADEPVVPTGVDRRRRIRWVAVVPILVLAYGLAFVCLFFLTYVLALVGIGSPMGPDPYSEVLKRMLKKQSAWAFVIGLVVGVAFQAFVLDRSGRKQR